jgi:predicted CopG family antitoxin
MTMTSKTISVTEDVYNDLMRAKGKNESFSEFFTRMLQSQRKSLDESFGAWKLTSDEVAWFTDVQHRDGRRWRHIEPGVLP